MQEQLTNLQSSEILCESLPEGWADRYPWGQPGFERVVFLGSGTTAFCLGAPFPILDTPHITVMLYGKNQKLSVTTKSCLPALSTLDSLHFVCSEMRVSLSDVMDAASCQEWRSDIVQVLKGLLLELCEDSE